MGTKRRAAARPLAMALALAPFAACSCGDRLGDEADPQVTPRASLAALASDNAGCDGVPLDLHLWVSGGTPPYTIRWDDDPDLVGTDGPKPTVTGFGTKEFFVTVTDASGSEVRTGATVTRYGLPTPAIVFARGAGEVCAGSEVVLDASTSVAAGGLPLVKFAWDLDADGKDDAIGATTDPLVPFDGQQVRLTVADSRGCIGSAVQPFTVLPAPTAVIDVHGPPKLCDGDLASFDGSRSQDGSTGPVAAYAWDMDGNGSADQTTSSTTPFAPAGPVRLTVSGANACVDTAIAAVPVLGPRRLYPFAPVVGNNTVDIIFVVDNSGSMGEEIAAIEDNINVNFAEIIQASEIDYRIILISHHGRNTDESICIRSPLAGTTCQPTPPSHPANTSRFFHYSVEVDSHNSLELLLSTYDKRDMYDLAHDGWRGWLRDGARRVIVEISDDESRLSADDFETGLFKLSGAPFGTATLRNYVFHSIVGLAANSPDTAPWLPADPIGSRTCRSAMAAGVKYQELSRRTGGLRFPVCKYDSFDAVFEAIATDVIEDALSCEFTLPAVSPPDSDTLEIERTAGDGSGIQVFRRVAGVSDCAADGFYLDGAAVRLCPAACTTVQADVGGGLALSGCEP